MMRLQLEEAVVASITSNAVVKTCFQTPPPWAPILSIHVLSWSLFASVASTSAEE